MSEKPAKPEEAHSIALSTESLPQEGAHEHGLRLIQTLVLPRLADSELVWDDSKPLLRATKVLYNEQQDITAEIMFTVENENDRFIFDGITLREAFQNPTKLDEMALHVEFFDGKLPPNEDAGVYGDYDYFHWDDMEKSPKARLELMLSRDGSSVLGAHAGEFPRNPNNGLEPAVLPDIETWLAGSIELKPQWMNDPAITSAAKELPD
jgi:hypothetical protein